MDSDIAFDQQGWGWHHNLILWTCHDGLFMARILDLQFSGATKIPSEWLVWKCGTTVPPAAIVCHAPWRSWGITVSRYPPFSAPNWNQRLNKNWFVAPSCWIRVNIPRVTLWWLLMLANCCWISRVFCCEVWWHHARPPYLPGGFHLTQYQWGLTGTVKSKLTWVPEMVDDWNLTHLTPNGSKWPQISPVEEPFALPGGMFRNSEPVPGDATHVTPRWLVPKLLFITVSSSQFALLYTHICNLIFQYIHTYMYITLYNHNVYVYYLYICTYLTQTFFREFHLPGGVVEVTYSSFDSNEELVRILQASSSFAYEGQGTQGEDGNGCNWRNVEQWTCLGLF